MNTRTWWMGLALLAMMSAGGQAGDGVPFKLATFSADVTIPLGHRCMGLLPTKSQQIIDPLYAHGIVLIPPDQPPIVMCAVDWCEIRNDSYDQWRQTLARAAGTSRARVLVSALHQHDAPVVDAGAARLLSSVGLEGELFDEAFHDRTVGRVAEALKASLADAQPITRLGLGQTRVNGVASSRRVQYPDGRVRYDRGSRSGSDPWMAEAAEGPIDPYLKLLCFFNGDTPVAAVHAYATHPMSYYGAGGVTSDFVGLARERRRRDDFKIHQMYVSGCSGDVTAGKFNDGSQKMRRELTNRLYQAMVDAWRNLTIQPATPVEFRHAELELPFHSGPQLTHEVLNQSLHDESLSVEKRIYAAMSLSSRQRVEAGRPIDFPCLDLGVAQIVLFPGEAFVGYQLLAQKIRSDSFVLSIGYGECWPGYVPTAEAWEEGFTDQWMWVAPGAEQKIERALKTVLLDPGSESSSLGDARR